MCIAIIKPKGIPLPDKKYLENAFSNNRDGAGFATLKPGQQEVGYMKGYFDFDTYYEALEASVNEEDVALIHMRIATHGGTTKSTCHPFPVTPSIDEMSATAGRTPVALIHNGVLRSMTNTKRGVSDTMRLAQYIAKAGVRQYNSRFFAKLMDPVIGQSNKVALLTRHGYVKLGNYWQEDEGVFWSNGTYKYSSRFNNYNCGFGGWDGYDDFSYSRPSTQRTNVGGQSNKKKNEITVTEYTTFNADTYCASSEIRDMVHSNTCPACLNVMVAKIQSVANPSFLCGQCKIQWNLSSYAMQDAMLY